MDYSYFCLQAKKNCFASAEKVLNLKNQRRELMLKKYGALLSHIRLKNYHTSQKIMLAEGCAAQLFWKQFSLLLPVWCNFRARNPGSNDIVNRLLDIGYHHITSVVKKILEKYDVSPALGILHVARASKSAPLAYDLVEMFRADIVETEVLKFLRIKKTTNRYITPKRHSHFFIPHKPAPRPEVFYQSI
ncbi:MAG: CRISPR-associated endonuclease Cas1 [Candidatus Staskawiczbacteria bacterium RIFCSPLOWO2_01_FULL_38_12b]|uniref:CRISPR-associated endonuclease Cas1 n=1 Tax=Candidatus Staskawiczbacteria bacterium RIFCSPLOWO2_01_FULL_38_12b TaxID=1802214 RepID=A0A1G2IHU5_9BACT|nr:MAG: CRISPR-associated endonuclease Cas1 [Candidatus Staskawiczbacteria bacterium RIFCSPLOWO2_01_FULL_38_12b]QBM02639.1 CRISPR-associated endonuclease Cas1 [uncultured archaeon]